MLNLYYTLHKYLLFSIFLKIYLLKKYLISLRNKPIKSITQKITVYLIIFYLFIFCLFLFILFTLPCFSRPAGTTTRRRVCCACLRRIIFLPALQRIYPHPTSPTTRGRRCRKKA